MLKFLTAALTLLFACLAPAQTAAPPKLEDALKSAAEASRNALISFEVSRAGLATDELITYRGFFISSDGLAVAPLQAFDGGRFTARRESDGSPLAVSGVVAVDLDYGIAIVRTDQQAGHFLVVSKRDSAIGEMVAILRAKEHGGTLTVPIMARRQAPIPRSRKYLEILSVGANLGDHGILHVPAGTPIFNSKGHVTGCLYAPTINATQRFLFAAPGSLVAKRIPRDSKTAATIPFPLPSSLQPADPLALDPSYLRGRTAQIQGEFVEAERLLRQALARQPKSPAGWQRLGYVLRARQRNEPAMEAFKNAVAHGNNLGTFLLNQADQLSLMGKLDEATTFLALACKKSPLDFDLHRAYALALRAKKEEAGAEKHLDIATRLAPDAISGWSHLSKCLAAQGKWDKEKIASDKIYELESIYRPR